MDDVASKFVWEDKEPQGAELRCTWVLWHSKKPYLNQSPQKYRQSIVATDTFEYQVEFDEGVKAPRTQPSGVEVGSTLHFFRKDSRNRKPCWERYPNGGSWTFMLPVESEITKTADEIWMNLLRGTISEGFQDARMVGVVVGKRATKHYFSVWHRNCAGKNMDAFAKRIQDVLGIEDAELVFKPFVEAMEDGATTWSIDSAYSSKSPRPSSVSSDGGWKKNSFSGSPRRGSAPQLAQHFSKSNPNLAKARLSIPNTSSSGRSTPNRLSVSPSRSIASPNRLSPNMLSPNSPKQRRRPQRRERRFSTGTSITVGLSGLGLDDDKWAKSKSRSSGQINIDPSSSDQYDWRRVRSAHDNTNDVFKPAFDEGNCDRRSMDSGIGGCGSFRSSGGSFRSNCSSSASPRSSFQKDSRSSFNKDSRSSFNNDSRSKTDSKLNARSDNDWRRSFDVVI